MQILRFNKLFDPIVFCMNMYVLRNPFLDLRTEREKNLNLSVSFWCEITIQIHTHNNCLYDPTDSCLGLPIKNPTLFKSKNKIWLFLFLIWMFLMTKDQNFAINCYLNDARKFQLTGLTKQNKHLCNHNWFPMLIEISKQIEK